MEVALYEKNTVGAVNYPVLNPTAILVKRDLKENSLLNSYSSPWTNRFILLKETRATKGNK